MSEHEQTRYLNSYHNGVAVPQVDEDENPDYTRFYVAAGEILEAAAELARVITTSHQSAIALIINGDWSQARKYFSLSEKYGEWSDYKAAATGYGIHGYITKQNDQSLRLTQQELEDHPAWRNFGLENGKHPPMRGWLVVPLVGSDRLNYGLLQVSDRLEEDYTEQDETELKRLGKLTSTALDALAQVHLSDYRSKIETLRIFEENG